MTWWDDFWYGKLQGPPTHKNFETGRFESFISGLGYTPFNDSGITLDYGVTSAILMAAKNLDAETLQKINEHLPLALFLTLVAKIAFNYALDLKSEYDARLLMNQVLAEKQKLDAQKEAAANDTLAEKQKLDAQKEAAAYDARLLMQVLADEEAAANTKRKRADELVLSELEAEQITKAIGSSIIEAQATMGTGALTAPLVPFYRSSILRRRTSNRRPTKMRRRPSSVKRKKSRRKTSKRKRRH